MFVIPNKKTGAPLSVMDPERMDVLPPEGRDVQNENPVYWQRRISDGDVSAVAEKDIPAAIKALETADRARADQAQAALVTAEAEKTPAPQVGDKAGDKK